MKIIRGIITFFITVFYVLAIRWGWWKHRAEKGHPISLWRAFFGRFPRFGSYEYNEPGCPDWTKRDYEAVMDAKDL